MTDFRTLRKVELHLHLEGAAPPAFIRKLADEQGKTLSGVFDENGDYQWANFAQFLKVYEAACDVLRGPDEFHRLVKAVLAEQAKHNVLYTEHFLAADLCEDGDPAAWPDYLAAMTEAAGQARAEHGIECRFISTCIRHFGPERAERAALTTVNTPHPLLTGFGMGGDELHLMPRDFARAFSIAGEADLNLTSHAGEICGPEMVTATLDALNVQRIGHGVRSIEDPNVVDRLARENITLEVNPGSNISLSIYENWTDHPIKKLRDAGVRITISTDDPPYFHTSMTHEFDMLHKHLGFTAQDFTASKKTAIDAAFCDVKTKERIKAQL